MKKTFVLPVLVMMFSILGIAAPNAMAATSTIIDKTSCESPLIDGVWSPIISTCTVKTLVIGPTDTLVISPNVNFNIGSVTSSGVITNDGKINIANGGVITTSGAFSNHGTISNADGTITNSGPFENTGILTSFGTITNGPTGVITNAGSLTSSGVITSSGTIITTSTGIITNNGGTLTNTLNMVNGGTIITSGTFTNSGPVMNIGDIVNQGLLSNSNTITNPGKLFNLCGGSITNSGTITVNEVIHLCVA